MKFISHWGAIQQTPLPSILVSNGNLSLSPKALKVLACLFHTEKSQRFRHSLIPSATREACVKITVRKLSHRTGYTDCTVSSAFKELAKAGYIRRERDRGECQKFLCSECVLLHPGTGDPLIRQEGQSLLHANDLRYFTVPSCVIVESDCRWSLASLGNAETKIMFALLWYASRKRSLSFGISNVELRRLAGLEHRAYVNGLATLEDKGLARTSEHGQDGSRQRTISVTLCDPHTGWPVATPDGDDEGDPANYRTPKGNSGKEKRLDLNGGSVEDIHAFILSMFDGQVVEQGDDLMVQCPFHPDHTPSCSVSPSKRCFYCFGCKASGNLLHLVERVTGCDRAGAIQKVAAATGQSPVFRQPDAKADALYEYRDTTCKLLKQVLRFPGKVFQQRRPVAGGWSYKVSELPPMLFNIDRAQYADTVVVCEGERDAQNVTELRLRGRHDVVVGITSGGARSWDDSLAKLFRPDQRVIVLGDDDDPGRAYVADAAASLEAEGIEFITASFAGTGAKDVSDYLEEHSPEELIRHIGSEWLRMPDGRQIVTDDAPCTMDEALEITI